MRGQDAQAFLRYLAKAEGMSVNQFVSSAAGEQPVGLRKLDLLKSHISRFYYQVAGKNVIFGSKKPKSDRLLENGRMANSGAPSS